LYRGGRKSHEAEDEETPVRRKLPPGGRLPALNHKPNGALRHHEDMYDDEDDDDDDDDDDEDEEEHTRGRPRRRGNDRGHGVMTEDTRGRPRSAAGGRKLPPLAMGDLGGKDH